MAEHGGAAAQAKSVDAESVDAPEQIWTSKAPPRTSTRRTSTLRTSTRPKADALRSRITKKTGAEMGFAHSPGRSPSGSPSSWRLLGVGGWLGFRLHQDDQVRAQRNLYVQVARQTAINLTTINYTEVDADIKRVLDSSTGDFHDEFQSRSQPFVEVVKKVQSKTEGTIAEAGLLSYARTIKHKCLSRYRSRRPWPGHRPTKSRAGGGCVLRSTRTATAPRCRKSSSCREQSNRPQRGGEHRDVW